MPSLTAPDLVVVTIVQSNHVVIPMFTHDIIIYYNPIWNARGPDIKGYLGLFLA